jgi:hypothetical protein
MPDAMSLTAAEVKERLRARHPATQRQGVATVPGPWVCLEEYEGLDLLAFSSHSTPQQGAQRPPAGARYPRVGYEVKVSRADLRQELLHPHKRLRARMICHELYLAVPQGLLRPEELAYEEPKALRAPQAFARKRCPAGCQQIHYKNRRASGPYMIRNEEWDPATQPFEERYLVCPTCDGKGYLAKSRVEQEAPQLWVPKDVGLVEVSHNCRVVRLSPVNHEARLELDDKRLAELVRWTSARPDPRHAGVVESARERLRELRAATRPGPRLSTRTRRRRSD